MVDYASSLWTWATRQSLHPNAQAGLTQYGGFAIQDSLPILTSSNSTFSPIGGSWHRTPLNRALCKTSSGSWAILDHSHYFSWCFLDRYLTTIPNVLWLIGLSFSIIGLTSRPVYTSLQKHWDYYAKLVMLAFQMVVLVAFEFWLKSVSSSDGPLVDFTLESALTSVINLGLASAVHYLEVPRLEIPSDSLLWYWLFSCIANLLKVFAFVSTGHVHTWGFVLQCFLFFGGLFIFSLEVYMPLTRIHNKMGKASMVTSNAFSRATVSWINPFISYSNTNELKESDMPDLEEGFNVPTLAATLQSAWERTAQTSWWSLFRAVTSSFKSHIAYVMLFSLVSDTCTYSLPFVLSRLISFVNNYNEDAEATPAVSGVYIALLIFGVTLLKTYCENMSHLNVIRIYTGVNGALYGCVYRKSLKLSPSAREQHPTAKIMNFVTVDLAEITFTFMWIAQTITFPVQLAFCLSALSQFLGPSFVAGMFALGFAIPVNAYVTKLVNDVFTKTMAAKDTRVNFTTNLFTNAKSLKLYGWESAFLERLLKIRNDQELKFMMKERKYNLISTVMWNIQPYLVATFVFGSFLLFTDKPLTAEILFPCLVLFKMLSEVISMVPMAILSMVQSKVSFERIASVMMANEEDLSKVYSDLDNPVTKYGESSVHINNATVAWTENEDATIALEEVDFYAKKGELSCIVGKVGTGKSALLKTICGSMCVQHGSVNVKGHLAYVPQDAWLINRTVKENILFESRYDPEFYQRTIEACCLLPDIDQWPDGDETEIGEKGVSLSGGQKARVSLARAVYSRADIYVLDDILSAVDEHVASHLITHLLDTDGLLASKTIVLATNNIRILHKSSNIAMLQNKKIVEQGSYAEVMQTGGALAKLIKEYGKKGETSATSSTLVSEQSSQISVDLKRRSSVSTLRRASDASLRSTAGEVNKALKKTQKSEEINNTGSVHKNVFWRYIQAGGVKLALLTFAGLMVTSSCITLASIWLKIWTDSGRSTADNYALYYLLVYFLIGVVFAFFYWLKDYLHIVVFSRRASKRMHLDMARSVLRAPMSFFETTPLGRILNRFTGDLNEVDDMIVFVSSYTSELVMNLTLGLGVIFWATPYVLISILPLTALYLYYQRLYVNTSRQTKRISSATKSPLLAHLDESLKGVDVIRAYSKTKYFIHLCELHAEMQLRAIFSSQTVDRWLALRLSFIGAIIGLLTALSAVYMTVHGNMTAGLVGLVMANALELTTFLAQIVKQSVIIEKAGVALERIFQYTDLTPEAPEHVEGNIPPAYWPNHGAMQFNDYSVRYRDNLDLVLKDINLDIKPHEKIGVVGRTGAGKSTLTLALFRIVEPAAGHMTIDSINTSNIGLQDLRQNLSIIPQDAQIFSGSIRDNLDPLGKHTEDNLNHALKLCHLQEHVNTIGGLDAELKDGGSNLSKGQCQLMCLARALLHHSNILVLDEATASVDVETDKIIQETIRSEFKHKTIVTVAHRLNTIMDSDRIVVLDKGQVAEFDTPANLLAKKESQFYSLCEKGGFVSNSD